MPPRRSARSGAAAAEAAAPAAVASPKRKRVAAASSKSKKSAAAKKKEEEEAEEEEEEEEEPAAAPSPKAKSSKGKPAASKKAATKKAATKKAAVKKGGKGKKAAADEEEEDEAAEADEEEEEAPPAKKSKKEAAPSKPAAESPKPDAAASKPAAAPAASGASSSSGGLDPVDLVISLDTTGSMSSALMEARKNISDLIKRMFKELPHIRIGLICHGDYCDEHHSYTIKQQDLSTDQSSLTKFIETVGPTGGGDWPECYELVLHNAQKLAWRAGSTKALIMVGDAIPHEAHSNPGRLDWRAEADKLKDLGIVVYSVQALDSGNSQARMFWSTIAEKTHGYHLRLDQFSYIRDVLLSVCLKQAGDERVQSYEQEIVARPSGLSRSMRQFFDVMLKRAPSASSSGSGPVRADGLRSCAPAKYQVLDVPSSMSIKEFVSSQPGLTFKTGRGYYEFTKAESISKKKHIVLMSSDGTLYEGDTARAIAKIGDDEKRKLKPEELDGFTCFVQSTSVNRNLVGGTRFLYLAADWTGDE